jgi:hypothetical protein
MASHTRILNITRNYSLKHKQALRAVENCACAWVVFGVSVRDLSLAESIAKRNQQASLAESLPLAELRTVIFRPSETSQPISQRAKRELIQSAAWFCAASTKTDNMLVSQ